MAGRRSFGSVRKRGQRWEASYWHAGRRHTGPASFGTKSEALDFLATAQSEIRRNTWIDPAVGPHALRGGRRPLVRIESGQARVDAGP